MSANTAERGLIMWLNPAKASTPVPHPVPLNLKLTLETLILSAGSYSYDIYDLSEELQYAFIMNLIKNDLLMSVPAEKSLDVNNLLYFYWKYFPNDPDPRALVGTMICFNIICLIFLKLLFFMYVQMQKDVHICTDTTPEEKKSRKRKKEQKDNDKNSAKDIIAASKAIFNDIQNRTINISDKEGSYSKSI